MLTEISELNLSNIGFYFSENLMQYRIDKNKYLLWNYGDTCISMYDNSLKNDDIIEYKNINTIEKIEQIIKDLCPFQNQK